jgi:transcriptional regulator with XRE-family HTH domain
VFPGKLRTFVEEIRRAREAAGLTLAEVSRRCGIDQSAPSRLENGHNKNPTFDTLWRYPPYRRTAVGWRLVLTTEAIRDTRPARVKANRVRAAPDLEAGLRFRSHERKFLGSFGASGSVRCWGPNRCG